MDHDNKAHPRPARFRNLLRITGPVVVLVGIGLVAFSAMSFVSTVGTVQSSKLSLSKGRSLRPPEYGWCRWAGMTLIAAGVVMSSLGFELFTTRKPKPDTPEPPRRKTLGQPLGQLGKKSTSDRPASGRKKKD